MRSICLYIALGLRLKNTRCFFSANGKKPLRNGALRAVLGRDGRQPIAAPLIRISIMIHGITCNEYCTAKRTLVRKFDIYCFYVRLSSFTTFDSLFSTSERRLMMYRVDIMGRDCCLINCLTLLDCKLAASDQCRHAPIECATGKYIL